jgi:hypothetical protein
LFENLFWGKKHIAPFFLSSFKYFDDFVYELPAFGDGIIGSELRAFLGGCKN